MVVIDLSHEFLGLATRVHTMMGMEANSRQFFPQTSTPEATVHEGVFRRVKGRPSTGSMGGTGLGYRIGRIARPIFRP